MFKKISIILAAALMAATPYLDAQTKTKSKAIILPKVEEFIPVPPAGGTEEFLLDSVMYQRGKALRDTPRGEVAKADATISLAYYMERFGAVMGHSINPKDNPALAKYMKYTYRSARESIVGAKTHFHRMRPYQYFNEPSLIPEDESPKDFSSYPSGHSVRAWAIALALINVDPAHQEEILKTAYDMCMSRIIAGYHYKSDIDGAIMAASAAYSRLSTKKEFRKMQDAAIAEFNNHTK